LGRFLSAGGRDEERSHEQHCDTSDRPRCVHATTLPDVESTPVDPSRHPLHPTGHFIGLSAPLSLGAGDATRSPFAGSFLRIFVREESLGRAARPAMVATERQVQRGGRAGGSRAGTP
jgi:hypothetical protein